LSIIDNFEKMLASGQDSALLRYSLGTAYQKAGDSERALINLANAVEQDPAYSAAWKVYGRLLVEVGRMEEAISAFETGIGVAEEKGDIQAAKEMRVFLKRAIKKKDE
jgi:Tfp pilus assembly protein PilF